MPLLLKWEEFLASLVGTKVLRGPLTGEVSMSEATQEKRDRPLML